MVSTLITQLCSLIDTAAIIESIGDNVKEFECKDSVMEVITKSLDYFKYGHYEYCRQWLQVMMHWTWEQLHTGHWKDVPLTYRKLYSYLVLLEGLIFSIKGDYPSALASIDKGLLLGAPIMLGDNYLKQWATALTAKITINSTTGNNTTGTKRVHSDQCSNETKVAKSDDVFNMSSSACTVPLVECPSIELFQKEYVFTGKPVIIKGCMNHWPAMSNRLWSIDYLKRIAGPRTVPVELGLRYTDEDWSQKLMTVQDFIDQYILLQDREKGPSISNVGYLAQHQLFDQIPELRKDICIPDYCCTGECNDVDINAWFGPKGTVSPLHYDPKHNLLAQVIGEKFIKLYLPSQTPYLYPHEGLLHNTSQVDVESPDLLSFPLFTEAQSLECLLTAGDMLYIPPTCWHYVRSLSISFSVSFWWQ